MTTITFTHATTLEGLAGAFLNVEMRVTYIHTQDARVGLHPTITVDEVLMRVLGSEPWRQFNGDLHNPALEQLCWDHWDRTHDDDADTLAQAHRHRATN